LFKYNKEKLAIQYIHGKLSAEIIGGSEQRTWNSNEIIMESDVFYNELESIPEKLNFKGENVSMVIVAPSIDYLVIKTPPMKQKDLHLFLNRKAHSTKGDAHAWCYTSLQIPNKEDNIYLHLVPEEYRAVFLKFCNNRKYQPVYLVPLAAVTPLLLESNHSDNLEMVAAAAGESTFLVIGKKNAPYLIREVPYNWLVEEQATLDRLSREIQRTVLFTRQQYNKQITTIRFIGSQSEKAKALAGTISGTEIFSDDNNIHWALLPYLQSPTKPDNLIPKDILGYNKRKRMTFAFIIMIFLFFMFSISLEIFYQFTNHKIVNAINKSNVRDDISQLLNQKMELDIKRSEILTNNGLSESIVRQKFDPVTGWFAGYATDCLPDSLYLSRFLINRDSIESCWNFEIEGYAPRNSISAARLLNEFQSKLTNAPSYSIITIPWKMQWIENLQRGGTLDSERKGKIFRISGRIK
jgi:hypothetical protein